MSKKKVLVAGFFDLLHSGHIRFLEEAHEYGDVYVSIGSDENSIETKHKTPIFSEEERKYMLESLKFVKQVDISKGKIGSMSFDDFACKIKPDYFITNEDGSDLALKDNFCKRNNIEFKVLKRIPKPGLQERSSTSIKEIDKIPHRLDLIGFYDQKIINNIYPGSVILANIDRLNLEDRSGMSSSTRNVIRRVFGNSLPEHIQRDEIAKIIFAVENPPGHKYISGVVDQLGLCLPGVNRLKFDDNYWPYKIEKLNDYKWLQNYLFLKKTKPRPLDYEVFDGRENFSIDNIKNHSSLGEKLWSVLNNKDIELLGNTINQIHESQKLMIPGYESNELKTHIENIKKNHLGVKLMGAGGYGYLLVVSKKPEKDFIKIAIT